MCGCKPKFVNMLVEFKLKQNILLFYFDSSQGAVGRICTYKKKTFYFIILFDGTNDAISYIQSIHQFLIHLTTHYTVQVIINFS